jgi:hypothetical protein
MLKTLKKLLFFSGIHKKLRLQTREKFILTFAVLGKRSSFIFCVSHEFTFFQTDFVILSNAGVLKLYLLTTPIFVFRNLMTLQDALRPSRLKNIAKESLIWELYSQIYSKILIFKVWRPFSGNWHPQKGRDP